MSPVAYDLFEVVCRAEQEVFSPLIPVHHHGAINVHAKETHRHFSYQLMAYCVVLHAVDTVVTRVV